VLWGDSGKGAVAGRLVQEGATFSVRFSGGMNAGHTSEIDGVEYVTNLMPCSVLYGGVGAIGPMCVIMPFSDGKIPQGMTEPRRGFREEVESLQARGIVVDRDHLIVDPNASITCSWHLAIEALGEGGSNRIGSTGRGIAPTYAAIATKCRITVGDCMDERRLDQALFRVQTELEDRISCKGISPYTDRKALLEWGQWLRSVATIRRVDTWLAQILVNGHDVVLEGAQGALLDPVWSQPCSTSCPIWPPIGIGNVFRSLINIGVFKAMSSRVGEGPFPTEIIDGRADMLRDLLHEFGATTKRPRRLGWLHFAALREGVRRTGATVLIPTKLDPLVGVGICTYDGLTVDGLPVEWWESEWDVWESERPGQCSDRVRATGQMWLQDMREPMFGITRVDDLPRTARDFMALIQEKTGVPVPMMKTGPGSAHMALKISIKERGPEV
jgi:adenylosuccinate synthase